VTRPLAELDAAFIQQCQEIAELSQEEIEHMVAEATARGEDISIKVIERRAHLKVLGRASTPFNNRSRPTTGRRGKQDMERIQAVIYDALSAEQPMTVRQVFYQLVTRGVIAKSEQEYKHTVIRLLVDMRRDGTIPYAWIADATRWQRKPRTYDSLADMMRETARLYRRNLWTDAAEYVEVWLEKEALAGVLYDVTAQWDVPLMVTRGYPSDSFVHAAAEQMRDQDRPTVIYYFGDHDPSGRDIERSTREKLEEFSDGADLTFTRLAITEDQVTAWALPTRPTKPTDSRSRGFAGESVEVDAIPPRELRALAEEAITAHLDPGEMKRLQTIEREERATLERYAKRLDRRGAA
jgi:hypothetical protein